MSSNEPLSLVDEGPASISLPPEVPEAMLKELDLTEDGVTDENLPETQPQDMVGDGHESETKQVSISESSRSFETGVKEDDDEEMTNPAENDRDDGSEGTELADMEEDDDGDDNSDDDFEKNDSEGSDGSDSECSDESDFSVKKSAASKKKVVPVAAKRTLQRGHQVNAQQSASSSQQSKAETAPPPVSKSPRGSGETQTKKTGANDDLDNSKSPRKRAKHHEESQMSEALVEDDDFAPTQIVPSSDLSQESEDVDVEVEALEDSDTESVLEPLPADPEPASLKNVDRNAKTLYSFLKKTNRPFGILDIVKANEPLTRLQVTKALAALVEKDLACCNEKKVHWINQNHCSNVGPARLKQVSDRVEILKTKKAKSVSERGVLQREIHILENQPGDEVLMKQVRDLEESLAATRSALDAAALKAKEDNQVDLAYLEERSKLGIERLEEEFKFYRNAWSERRMQVTDLLNSMLEDMPGKVKMASFAEDLGVETDEAKGVKLKDYRLK
mmetsp:Transcript_20949/g.37109  ORF Transcript_20949/g.37109 Transcript_20949/m.37109 type:complete len:504 (-) Transcript_20949:76-1587(-)